MSIVNDPATRCEAVVPSDTTALLGVRAIYVGVGGNVAIQCKGNTAPVTHIGMVAGQVYPVQATRIFSTGTTATNIVAWY